MDDFNNVNRIRNRVKVLWGFLFFILALSILHSAWHIYYFDASVSDIFGKGISGLLIGKADVGEEIKNFVYGESVSKIFVLAEWILIFLAILLLYIERKMGHKKELFVIGNDLRNNIRRSGTATDLDVLYDLLKERKRLSISAIARAFNVSRDLVMEWGKIFQSKEIAEIEYPLFGQPEIVFNEKDYKKK
ncbi:hypothetical protein HYV50_02960 [Candidatus Pacearchaeota archaeon]|nr:hypothetical protein [Candidatus Pacearchaeota archaeon]